MTTCQSNWCLSRMFVDFCHARSDTKFEGIIDISSKLCENPTHINILQLVSSPIDSFLKFLHFWSHLTRWDFHKKYSTRPPLITIFKNILRCIRIWDHSQRLKVIDNFSISISWKPRIHQIMMIKNHHCCDCSLIRIVSVENSLFRRIHYSITTGVDFSVIQIIFKRFGRSTLNLYTMCLASRLDKQWKGGHGIDIVHRNCPYYKSFSKQICFKIRRLNFSTKLYYSFCLRRYSLLAIITKKKHSFKNQLRHCH